MKFSILVLAFVLSAVNVQAANLQTFLKHCGYGTLFGAGAGVVSLALTDKPGENTGNIAKGASLGLYAGIGYGLYKLGEPAPKVNTVVDPYATVMPIFQKGQWDGVQMLVQFASF